MQQSIESLALSWMILLILLYHSVDALQVLGDAELLLGASIVHEADLPEDLPLCPALQQKGGHLSRN